MNKKFAKIYILHSDIFTRIGILVWFLIMCLIPLDFSHAQIQFVNVAQQAGVGGSLNSPLSTNMAWGDYDNDGFLDLYVTNWGTSVSEAEDILFHNNGNGTFTNVAQTAGVATRDNGIAAVWGDYDNDGFLDLYVVNYYEQDVLYHNNGNGTFTDVTGDARMDVNPIGNSTYAVWGDYDKDGDLDLYLCKFYAANELYTNNGNGTFTLVTNAGVGDIRDSWKAMWVDYDNDNDCDLYVINREQDNAIYRNNGDGTFTNVSGIVPLNDTELGHGGTWGDFNGDGLLDLFLANIGANKLYRNSGNGAFVEEGSTLGVRQTGVGWEHWDTAWGDYDGDGDMDLFVVGGAESGDNSVGLFMNISNRFTNVTSNSGDINPGPLWATACSFADYDNDGDLDIYVTSYRSEGTITMNTLYQNQKNSNNFIKVRVRGKGAGFSNASGIGAKVRVYDKVTNAFRGLREIYSSANPLEAVFGLITGRAYRIEVTLPGSQNTVVRQEATAPAVITISEP